MDSVKPEPVSNGLVRTFAKVLRHRIAPSNKTHKSKLQEKFEDDSCSSRSLKDEEKVRNRATTEALLAKLFASISSVKAAYAQLQIAQSPYDADGIQSADEIVIKELKNLSELKKFYVKKQIDPSPQVTQLLAEIQEQQSLIKTYEIMGKKFESQLKIKESKMATLRDELVESERQNRSLEQRLNPRGSLSVLDDLHLSGLNPNHFIAVLKPAVKSIRRFVKLMIHEMESSGWDLDSAASSINPNVIYVKSKHRCFAFESFVCREMFDGFQFPKFSLPNESVPSQKQRQGHFFEAFKELKSIRPMEFLSRNPHSTFGKFCRAKYLHLVHHKMESSLFGDLNQRNLLNSGEYPETSFFATFAEMAKWVWLLHCLAFSFKPEASIFQMRKGCRFSEVYMESLTEEAFFSSDNTPEVAFTIVPGFKIGKTVIQCQVYLSPASSGSYR